MATLKGVSDIRRYWRCNSTPVFFVNETNINLFGIEEWIGNFWFINSIDCFDGRHPKVFVPPGFGARVVKDNEIVNNELLAAPDVVDFVRSHGPGGIAVFAYFDERTESLCRDLGLQICFPPTRLRRQIDNKVEASRIAQRAGAACVPHVLAKIGSYEQLRQTAGHLGAQLVVQAPFGGGGRTTFFISDQQDWERHAPQIASQAEVKIMRRVRCRIAAVEACVTRHGVLAAPIMTELAGFPELTIYPGGWCGSEIAPEAFSEDLRRRSQQATIDFGEEAARLGYRGYLQLDFLIDLDTDELYLGEVNPRLTGDTNLTCLAAYSHGDAPLFLFHLLEWADVAYEIDVDEINARWLNTQFTDAWAQLIFKHTREARETVTRAPRTGVWRLAEDGAMEFLRPQMHRMTVEDASQGFFFREAKERDNLEQGVRLGRLVLPGRVLNDRCTLNDRARAWIRAVHAAFVFGGEPST